MNDKLTRVLSSRHYIDDAALRSMARCFLLAAALLGLACNEAPPHEHSRADDVRPDSGAVPRDPEGASGRDAAEQAGGGTGSKERLVPDSGVSSCRLEYDLKWQFFSWGWSDGYQRLTQSGTYERRRALDNRENGTPYVSMSTDAGASDTPGVVCAMELPACGKGKVCLNDICDALNDPEVATLLPAGMKFPDAVLVDGAAFYLYLGEATISFGVPLFSDLPPAVADLYALLSRLDQQQLAACASSCSRGRPTGEACEQAPGCSVYARWAQPAWLAFDDCDDAQRCAQETCELLHPAGDPAKCSTFVIDACTAGDADAGADADAGG
jgi:hypothetical protein